MFQFQQTGIQFAFLSFPLEDREQGLFLTKTFGRVSSLSNARRDQLLRDSDGNLGTDPNGQGRGIQASGAMSTGRVRSTRPL